MPNWKKIALSGSNPEFGSLIVDNAITASYFTGDGSALTGVPSAINGITSTNAAAAAAVTGSVDFASISTTNDTAAKTVRLTGFGTNGEYGYLATFLSSSGIAAGTDIFISNTGNSGADGTFRFHSIVFGSNLNRVDFDAYRNDGQPTTTGDVFASNANAAILATAAFQNEVTANSSQSVHYNGSGVPATLTLGYGADGSNTNVSGSLTVDNAITASYFTGDGSALTGVTSTIVEESTVLSTFSNVATASINHGFNTKNVIISIYDDNDDIFIPSRITTTDQNNVEVTFDPVSSGRVVIAKGGHLVSGSIYRETITGVTSSIITHNLNEEYPFVQCYLSNSKEVFIPSSIKSINGTQTEVDIGELLDTVVVIKR
jgi:hypothetical protein